jgi:hypothetical protein
MVVTGRQVARSRGSFCSSCVVTTEVASRSLRLRIFKLLLHAVAIQLPSISMSTTSVMPSHRWCGPATKRQPHREALSSLPCQDKPAVITDKATAREECDVARVGELRREPCKTRRVRNKQPVSGGKRCSFNGKHAIERATFRRPLPQIIKAGAVPREAAVATTSAGRPHSRAPGAGKDVRWQGLESRRGTYIQKNVACRN